MPRKLPRWRTPWSPLVDVPFEKVTSSDVTGELLRLVVAGAPPAAIAALTATMLAGEFAEMDRLSKLWRN